MTPPCRASSTPANTAEESTASNDAVRSLAGETNLETADNKNGAENPTGSDSAGAGELALDVQVLNIAGNTIARSRVDPRLCNGIELKRLIADQAQEPSSHASGKVILMGPNGERIGDSEPLITDRLGLLLTMTPTLVLQAIRQPAVDFATLHLDCPEPHSGSIEMRDDVLHVFGRGDLNVCDGVRCSAPLAWVEAPLAPVWTATVWCKLVEAHDLVISLFTVYDGPDGSGTLAFSFGPSTWSGSEVGYQ